MRQPKVILEPGLPVRTNDLVSYHKFPCGQYLSADVRKRRKSNICGVIYGEYPGSSGSVYWVRHSDRTLSVYSCQELEFDGPNASEYEEYFEIR